MPEQGARSALGNCARFACFAVAFAIAQWPALAEPWWFVDDYARILGLEPPFFRGCQNGRPLVGLWMATLQLDADGSRAELNMLLRALQALVHITVAFLAGSWLAAVLQRRSMFWATALFLLWPFQTEAVLWRTAASAPIGALLAVCAVRLAWPPGEPPRVRPRRVLVAAAALAGATWFHQTGSMIAWLLPVVAAIGGATRFWAWRRAGWLIVAHVVAAAVGFVITQLPMFATPRAALTADPWAKLGIVRELLSHVWLWRRFYPTPLLVAHGTLLVAAILAMNVRAWRWRCAPRWLALALLVVSLPIAPNLLVSESALPFRVMYLGPWLLVTAWALQCRVAAGMTPSTGAMRRTLAGAAIGVSLGLYCDIGRTNAREYVALFAAEKQVLQRAEQAASAQGIPWVGVEPPGADTAENPFGFVFRHGPSKVSAFQIAYAVKGRIERFSRLRLRPDAPSTKPAPNLDRRPSPATGFTIQVDPAQQMVWILQPR